jgi:DNA polymerase-3 subunit delta'
LRYFYHMQFVDVVGQQELKKHFITEINSGNIAHARLFYGKPGYGPLPLALAFASYLFCDNKQEVDSCGVCPSCLKVNKLQHPDLHFSFPTVQTDANKSILMIDQWRKQMEENPYFTELDWLRRIDPKERNMIISVHESQDIIKKLSLKAYEGGYKVMIVWLPEAMNAQAANKLLKLLEEPTPKTVFILVAESHESMLRTILSRTQVVRIPKIDDDELKIYLRKDAKIETAAIDRVVIQSDGDFIQAMAAYERQDDSEINREWFIKLMRVSYRKDVIGMLDWAEEISNATKDGQKVFLEYALHMVRQSMLKNYTGDQLTRLTQDEDAFLANFARFITGNNLRDFMLTFSDSHYYIERNANSKILFTNISFQVMRYIHAA